MPTKLNKSLTAKFARVKLFLCDVDGVLTDGTVLIGSEGEAKRFNILDGFGLRLLQDSGIKVGWISNRNSAATTQRATELKIDFLSQERSSKLAVAEKIRAKLKLSWTEVCYMGDDLVDLGLLARAGVAVSVPNGMAEVKKAVDHVTKAAGGEGAVREVVELILKAQHKWNPIVKKYAADTNEKG